MGSKRIYNYDLIKAFAIFLVCLYHFGTLNYDFLQQPSRSSYILYFISGISSMGVPLFFMVNGAFLLNREYDLKKHLLKTGQIFLLLIFWSTLTLLLTQKAGNEITSITEFIKAVFLFRQYRTKHLWFLQAMIYIYLLFPFIKALYDQKESKYTIYLTLVIFLFTFGNELTSNILNASSYITGIAMFTKSEVYFFDYVSPFYAYCSFALVYFIIGGLINRYAGSIPYHTYAYYGLFLLSLLLLFGIGIIKSLGEQEPYDIIWGGYDTVMTLAMSFAVYILLLKVTLTSERLKKIAFLIGSNTLGIYFLHVPLGFWLTDYYKRLAISTNTSMDLLYTLFLMLLSLALTLLLKMIPLLKKTVQL